MALKHEISEAEEMFRAALEFARMGLRAAFLLNGGAIVGILTFLGNVFQYPAAAPLLRSAKEALPCFIVGVFLAALSLAIAFLAQEQFYDAKAMRLLGMELREEFEKKYPNEQVDKGLHPLDVRISQRSRYAFWVRLAAILSSFASLILFLIGSFVAYSGL